MSQLQQIIRNRVPETVYLPRWIERAADIGIISTDPKVVRRQRLTNIFSLGSAFNAAAQMIVAAINEFWGFIVVHLALVLTTVAFLLIPRLHRWSDNLAAHMLLLVSISAIAFTTWTFGRDSQIYVYLTLAGVLFFAFGVESWRSYAGWFVVAAATMLILMFAAPKDGLFVPDNHSVRQVLAAQAFLNTLAVMSLLIFFALSMLRKAEIGLEEQYVRSSALIDTVFPAPIVARLTSGQEDRIADRIDGLTVVFADLVGFTRAAHDLAPEQIIDYLDAMVRGFDQLCAEHGIEKIKTIGDCYMAVGGITGDPRGQAIAAGRFAVAMLRAQAHRPPLGGQHLTLRIGLHTGSATAGIIGDTRFAYDVWGDAVNMASRMESHGLPGQIQVSEAFCAAVGEAFQFEERGVIDIRGIGPTRTWLLRDVQI